MFSDDDNLNDDYLDDLYYYRNYAPELLDELDDGSEYDSINLMYPSHNNRDDEEDEDDDEEDEYDFNSFDADEAEYMDIEEFAVYIDDLSNDELFDLYREIDDNEKLELIKDMINGVAVPFYTRDISKNTTKTVSVQKTEKVVPDKVNKTAVQSTPLKENSFVDEYRLDKSEYLTYATRKSIKGTCAGKSKGVAGLAGVMFVSGIIMLCTPIFYIGIVIIGISFLVNAGASRNLRTVKAGQVNINLENSQFAQRVQSCKDTLKQQLSILENDRDNVATKSRIKGLYISCIELLSYKEYKLITELVKKGTQIDSESTHSAYVKLLLDNASKIEQSIIASKDKFIDRDMIEAAYSYYKLANKLMPSNVSVDRAVSRMKFIMEDYIYAVYRGDKYAYSFKADSIICNPPIQVSIDRNEVTLDILKADKIEYVQQSGERPDSCIIKYDGMSYFLRVENFAANQQLITGLGEYSGSNMFKPSYEQLKKNGLIDMVDGQYRLCSL